MQMFLPKTIDVFCNENITNALSQLYRKNMSCMGKQFKWIKFYGYTFMLAMVANNNFDQTHIELY